MARKAFTIDKFILGFKQLEITEPTKGLRRLFKVYEPTVSTAIYECQALSTELNVNSCQQEIAALEDKEKRYVQGLFMSNFCFINDIICVSRKIDHSLGKKEKTEIIKTLLGNINKFLPSFVFVPSDGTPL